MKRIIQKIIAASVCLLLAATLLYAQAPTTPDNAAKLKEEIRAVLRQLNDAALKKDEETYDRILAPDFRTVHAQKDQIMSRAAMLRSVATGEMAAPPDPNIKLTLAVEDLEVIGDERAATALFHLVMTFDLKDRREVSRGRGVSFFVRNGANWQLLAEYGAPLPRERVPQKIDSKAMDAILGEYQAEEGKVAVVTREGDKLFSQKTGFPKIELVPASEATFYGKLNGFETAFTFIRNDEGKVVQMIVHNPHPDGSVFVRKKIK